MKKTRYALLFLALFALAVPAAAEPGNGDDTLSFLVIGDWGMHGSRTQRRVAAAMDAVAAASRIDFIISTGDNFYPAGVASKDDPLWRRAYEEVYDLPNLRHLTWYVTLGNHDYLGDVDAELDYARDHPRWHLPRTYYQYTTPGSPPLVQLFFLDTNGFINGYHARPDRYRHIKRAAAADQLSWLRRQLAQSRATWKIVVGHHPVYSSGRHHGDTPELRRLLPPLFAEYGVQAYFAGHDHDLEYYRPPGATAYIISGGGAGHRTVTPRRDSRFAAASAGFVHVSLDPGRMTLRYLDDKGRELYSATMKPGAPAADLPDDT